MPEVIINGPDGRLEARYMPADDAAAPLALVLHPEPNRGGNMNNRVTLAMYNLFKKCGFHVIRFNFRGVGRSKGVYDKGEGELSDAAAALDWIEAKCPHASGCWVAGFSFGSWIGMQLMMRRPEIVGFVSVTPPAADRDFTFLAPCPSSGIVLHGGEDHTVPAGTVINLVDRIQTQKGVTIDLELIDNANHFFTNHLDELINKMENYLTTTIPYLKLPSIPE